MRNESIGPINRYLSDEVRDGEFWYGHADMNTGVRTQTPHGALDALLPTLLALGSDLYRVKRLQESGLKMRRLHGIEPEAIGYAKMQVRSPGYPLRPEFVESAYSLYR